MPPWWLQSTRGDSCGRMLAGLEIEQESENEKNWNQESTKGVSVIRNAISLP